MHFTCTVTSQFLQSYVRLIEKELEILFVEQILPENIKSSVVSNSFQFVDVRFLTLNYIDTRPPWQAHAYVPVTLQLY